MGKKKIYLFYLFLIFIITFSSIINSLLIYEKKNYNEQFPKVAESYWIIEKWNKTWDSGNFDAAVDMEIGASNNILITGSIDNGRLILIIKFNSSGNQIWNRTWGGYTTGNNWGYGIAEDSERNVYVCGKNILLKYDEFGDFVWSINLRGASGYNLEIENSDYIYIVGEYNADMILMKYNDLGNQIWNQTWGNSAKLDELHEVQINSEGNLIVGGQFNYEYAVTNWGTIIAKFNSSGVKLWQKTIGGYSSTAYEFRDIILDSNDNLFLCFTMGGPYLTYIYMYDSTGSRIRYAYIQEVYNCYLHLDMNGYLYLFVTIDSVSPWYTTIYKLNTSLTTEWQSSWIYDETKYEYAVEMGGDSNNNIYTALMCGEDIIIAKFTPSPPLNPSIIINYGEDITFSNKVSLTLSAKGAEEMCFKNGTMGDWTNWEPYNPVKELYLEGSVNNTDYFISVKFRNVLGESQIVSDNITYITYDLIIEPNLDNFSINIGETDFLLSWYVKSLGKMNDSFWITRNQVLISQGQWQHNTNITYYETEAFQAGLYNYTCFINDTIGKIVYSSIFVKVNLNPYPVNIKFPLNNIYYPNAEYTFNCSWLDDDGTIQKVKFEFNNKNYTVLTNHSGEFSYTLSNLPANESGYKFRWHGLDNDGAWNSTKLFTYILHKNNCQLLFLFNGTENNYFDAFNPFINITILNLDKTPGTLQLYVNNELKKEESENLLTVISLFPNGVYNITAILVDENYTAYSTYWLFIEELTPPEITFEYSDFYITPFKPEYYHEFLTLTCIIYDESPISWVYCCENSSGNFINRSMINILNRNWTITIDISKLNWNDIITFYFYANDTWGNVGIKNNSNMFYSINIFDFQAPSSIIEFIPHSGTNIVNKSTLFSIIANDNQGSGISTTFYKINNSNWINYTNPFDLSDFDSGTYAISFYSIDYAGNIEEIHSLIIILIEPQSSQRTKIIQGYNMAITLIIISFVITLSILKKRTKTLKIKLEN